MRIIFFIFIVQLLFSNNLYAQTTANNDTQDFAKTLPPLQALIDSALIYSPAMRMADNSILLSEYSLKSTNRDWMHWIYLQANARYGSDYYFTSEEVLIEGPTTSDPIRFTGGVSMRLPISSIFNYGLNQKGAKIEIEQSKIRKDAVEKGVREVVIAGYYDLLSKRNALDLRLELFVSANMSYEQAKQDYADNRTSLDAFTQANERYLSAKNAYEVQKNEFNKTILLFEEIIGFKLIK